MSTNKTLKLIAEKMGSKNQEHLWAEKKKKRKHTIFCDDCRSKISKEKHAQ